MSTPVKDASLPELVRTLADDARELVRAEVGLAKDELSKGLRSLIVVVAGATAATVVTVLALCVFAAAFVLNAGGSAIAALLAAGGGGVLLVLIAVIVSARMLAKPSATPTSEPGLPTPHSEVVR